MAYADTNVFIALLVGPAHPLHEPALSIFRRVADGDLVLVVTPVVVAELAYVGRSVLGWTRGVAADRLAELLSADGLAVAEAATVQHALLLYRERSKLDFADAYLAAAALEVGPAEIASFDAGLDTVAGIRRISA
jgi:Predicted nucleic acid-binding protein, contains PIN domain